MEELRVEVDGLGALLGRASRQKLASGRPVRGTASGVGDDGVRALVLRRGRAESTPGRHGPWPTWALYVVRPEF